MSGDAWRVPATNAVGESILSHTVLDHTRQRLNDDMLATLTKLHYEQYSVINTLLTPHGWQEDMEVSMYGQTVPLTAVTIHFIPLYRIIQNIYSIFV